LEKRKNLEKKKERSKRKNLGKKKETERKKKAGKKKRKKKRGLWFEWRAESRVRRKESTPATGVSAAVMRKTGEEKETGVGWGARVFTSTSGFKPSSWGRRASARGENTVFSTSESA